MSLTETNVEPSGASMPNYYSMTVEEVTDSLKTNEITGNKF